MTENKPLTVAEAADFLSVNPWQVRHYISRGILKAYKLGNGGNKKGSRRRWRIWKEDLISFINRDSNIVETNTILKQRKRRVSSPPVAEDGK